MNTLSGSVFAAKIFWGSLALSAAVVCAPATSKKQVFRNVRGGMTIHTNKADPPRIIFDLISKKRLVQHNQVAPQNEDLPLTNLNAQLIESHDPIEIQNKVLQVRIVESSQGKAVESAPTRKMSSSRQEAVSTPLPGRYLVTGRVQLRGGAMLGENNLELRRFEDGVAKEIGRISLTDATFAIDVDQPAGSLYAQIINPHGAVLARGIYRFPRTLSTRNISDVEIVVNRNNTFSYHPKEGDGANSDPEKKSRPTISVPTMATMASPSGDGYYSISDVALGSTSLVKIAASGYAQGAYLTQSGLNSELPMYSEPLAKAAVNLSRQALGTSVTQQTGSLVWGKVQAEGAALSKVVVEIEGHPEFRPVYLNKAWLPDNSLKATTSVGGFFFVDVPEGFYSLKATSDESYVSHANIQIIDEAVTPVTMKAALFTEPVDLKIYDAFSGQALSATVEMQSMGSSMSVNGVRELHIPRIDRLSLMSVRPYVEGYLPALYQYSDDDDYIHAPLIKNSWLATILEAKPVVVDNTRGVIVGFVVDQDFDVYLSQIQSQKKSDIIYFDVHGQVRERGVAGGGFILSNVPAGTQSVVVVSKATDQAASRVVPVNADSLNVLKFHF